MISSLTKLIDAEYQTGLLGAANSLMDYCKKRPQKSSEYMLLQKNLYDEFMMLQEHLIGIIQDAV